MSSGEAFDRYLSEIAEIPTLSPERERDLGRQIQQGERSWRSLLYSNPVTALLVHEAWLEARAAGRKPTRLLEWEVGDRKPSDATTIRRLERLPVLARARREAAADAARSADSSRVRTLKRLQPSTRLLERVQRQLPGVPQRRLREVGTFARGAQRESSRDRNVLPAPDQGQGRLRIGQREAGRLHRQGLPGTRRPADGSGAGRQPRPAAGRREVRLQARLPLLELRLLLDSAGHPPRHSDARTHDSSPCQRRGQAARLRARGCGPASGAARSRWKRANEAVGSGSGSSNCTASRARCASTSRWTRRFTTTESLSARYFRPPTLPAQKANSSTWKPRRND